MNGWIGVDLDGTLAYYSDAQDITNIGLPVRTMAERVKTWLAEGQDVRIVTARVAVKGKERARQRVLIQRWCKQYLGEVLPITASKDVEMLVLYDDRCIQVETNTGRLIGQEEA
jgi:hypothetical protein